MKWVTKNYRGDTKVWYSADVINRIREWATAEILAKKYDAVYEDDACETIVNFLNEVDK